MLCPYIRSSSYNGYEYCQLQYYFTYVLGYQSPSGKKAQLGTIVHKVMEVLATLKKEQQDNPDAKSLTIVDDAIGEVKCTPKTLHTKKFVTKMLKESYASYTNKCIHDYTDADYRFCDELVQTAIGYNDGQFDPRNRNIVAAEPHFDIPIEEPWAKFTYKDDKGKNVEGQLSIKGTIDFVTEVDDGVIEVIDWKTGRRLNWATGEEKTYEKLCEDPQLLLYNYAISKLFPEYDQAIMSIFFIRDGGPFSMCFDKDDQQKFLGMLEKRWKSITRNDFPQPCSKDRKSFKCTKLCHFYKTKWPGTNTSMCQYAEEHLIAFGYDETTEKMKRDGFDSNYYEAPG